MFLFIHSRAVFFFSMLHSELAGIQVTVGTGKLVTLQISKAKVLLCNDVSRNISYRRVTFNSTSCGWGRYVQGPACYMFLSFLLDSIKSSITLRSRRYGNTCAWGHSYGTNMASSTLHSGRPKPPTLSAALKLKDLVIENVLHTVHHFSLWDLTATLVDI